MNRLSALVVVVLVAGCVRLVEGTDLERMREQARLDPYDAGPRFPDGTTMRHPPAGTVPRERPTESPTGIDGELAEIPVAIDRALLDRGRDRFDRICAACHGHAGTGNPAIVENARVRPPPSLHEDRIRRQPIGRIVRTIGEGFGLMPGHADRLTSAERWAVAAYLRVLWRSRAVELATLPPDLRAEARAALAEREAP